MGVCNVINGMTATTTQNFLLDAGAFLKNFDPLTDTFETAKTEGKVIGATKGGGTFKATPTFRKIEPDGARGDVKGTQILESWEVIMEANIIEVTEETVALSLGVNQNSTIKEGAYTKIEGKNCVLDTDYIDNITWIGTLSGSAEPVIIQVFNALNTAGLELKMEDKSEGVLPLKFTGHSIGGDDKPPFAVYLPVKSEGA